MYAFCSGYVGVPDVLHPKAEFPFAWAGRYARKVTREVFNLKSHYSIFVEQCRSVQ